MVRSKRGATQQTAATAIPTPLCLPYRQLNQTFTISQLTPCMTMENIASSLNNFYSDYNQSGSGSTCQDSSHTVYEPFGYLPVDCIKLYATAIDPQHRHITSLAREPQRPAVRQIRNLNLPECGAYSIVCGNNQKHFNAGNLAILHGGPELPMLKRRKHELGLRELRRKDDVEGFEAAGLIDKAMDHDGIAVDGVRRQGWGAQCCKARAPQGARGCQPLQHRRCGEASTAESSFWPVRRAERPCRPTCRPTPRPTRETASSSDSPTTTAPNCPSLGSVICVADGWPAWSGRTSAALDGEGSAGLGFAAAAPWPGGSAALDAPVPRLHCRADRSFPGAEAGCAGPGANAPCASESAVSLTGGSTTVPCAIFKSESDMIAAGVGCAVGCETVAGAICTLFGRLNRNGRSGAWQAWEVLARTRRWLQC